MTSDQSADLPKAMEMHRARPSWAWLVTLGALIFAGWLGYQTWVTRGTEITVELIDGHGLRPGDPVKHRGILVGQVGTVELTDDLDRVVVTAILSAHASRLARAGARIWVVRPRVDATGIAGLETVIGPRYLAILPGSGIRQRRFVGLIEQPAVERIDPADLEIILESYTRGSLSVGAPVTYRQFPVGTVLSVGLSSDGGAVEARVHIPKAYTELIRAGTRFWRATGIQAEFGLGGASLQIESLGSLLTGGVALATPPGSVDAARTGHRFTLADDPKDEWLGWQPFVAIGSSYLPSGSPIPAPVRAVRGWESGRWFRSAKSRRGWLLPTRNGLLGPMDMLAAHLPDEKGPAMLEVLGQTIALTGEPAWSNGPLGMLTLNIDDSTVRWDPSRTRTLTEPEDCIIVGDPAAAPIPLAAARLLPGESSWKLDPTVPVDESWHGACVLSRADGFLVGIVLIEAGEATIAPPMSDK